MKVIIAGSTGVVGTSLIAHALSNSSITTLIGLARRETLLPKDLLPHANISKFKSVVLPDFGEYSDEVKKELEGSDLVIWTIAVVPLKHHTVSSFDEIRKISLDFAIKGIKTISQLPRGAKKTPLRFIYMSSSGSVREDEGGKKPFFLGEYTLMRGEAESRILKFARKSGGKVQACVARPGVITDKESDGMYKRMRVSMAALMGIPRVEVGIAAMALLEIGLREGGLEMEVFENEDLVRIGKGIGGSDGR